MFVYIEGSISSGKSTLLQNLRQEGFNVVFEPVEQWSHHLAGVYSSCAEDWMLPMQALALSTRMEALMRVAHLARTSIVIVERSLQSDALFAQDLRPEEMAVYDVLRSRYGALTGILTDDSAIHLYLQASPMTCMLRAEGRARPEEKGLTLSFLEKMHDRHEAAFGYPNLPQSQIIDANMRQADVLQAVLSKLQSLRI